MKIEREKKVLRERERELKERGGMRILLVANMKHGKREREIY